MSHEWVKLFVEKEGVYFYAYLDRCSICRTLRSTPKEPFWYMSPSWTPEEPECTARAREEDEDGGAFSEPACDECEDGKGCQEKCIEGNPPGPIYEDQHINCQEKPCGNAPLGCTDKRYCPKT